MSKLMENLKEVGRMQAEVKRRSMIFQVDHKERRAKELGLPYWAFYHMSFGELSFLDDDDEALAWWAELGAEAAASEAQEYAYTHAPEGMQEGLEQQCLEEAMAYVRGEKTVSGVPATAGA